MKQEDDNNFKESIRKELDRIELNIKNREVSLNIIEKNNLLETLNRIRKTLNL